MPDSKNVPLDDTDRAIVRILARDARTPNNAIAEAVGIAPSTCLTRVRQLRERGVVRGFHAEIDPAAFGLGIEAMIAVQLDSHDRDQVDAFISAAPRMPGVITVFHVAGVDDYLVHIAVPDTAALRDFVVDRLVAHPAVRHTETSIIFSRFRGGSLV